MKRTELELIYQRWRSLHPDPARTIEDMGVLIRHINELRVALTLTLRRLEKSSDEQFDLEHDQDFLRARAILEGADA